MPRPFSSPTGAPGSAGAHHRRGQGRAARIRTRVRPRGGRGRFGPPAIRGESRRVPEPGRRVGAKDAVLGPDRPFRRLVVEVHPDDYQPVLPILSMHLTQVRNHHTARAAPCGPEIDQDRLPLAEQRVETDALAVERPDGEVLRLELIEGRPRRLLGWLLGRLLWRVRMLMSRISLSECMRCVSE